MSQPTSAVIELTKTLISRKSVTPIDAQCQVLMAEMLAKSGFTNESMVFEDTTCDRRQSLPDIILHPDENSRVFHSPLDLPM